MQSYTSEYLTEFENLGDDWVFKKDIETSFDIAIFEGQLPSRQRAVFLLRIEGHPRRTIADKLKLSANTISKHLSEIKRKLLIFRQ